MTIRNTRDTYGFVSKFFHWFIFLLVACLIPVGYLMMGIQDKASRAEVINAHKLTGLTVLVLMLLRAAWAVFNIKPAAPFGTPQWQRLLERYGHLFLYLILIAMPIAGWTGAVAAGHAPHLLNWEFVLPVPRSKALSDVAFLVHETLAIVIIVVVSLHVLAALYHHFVLKDGVLRRMLPARKE